MPRGDLYPVRFQVYDPDDEHVTQVDFSQIYATFKRTSKDKTPLFQKALSRGTIEKINDGDYQFIIEPEDTNSLQYGEYVFDIELINDSDPRIKQTIYGTLRLSDEVTWAENEVR